ncbi:MAG: hypothetical protein HY647_01150, partial [Acidobacteria bacterium]|nr:hypothetical protein [Acidobacteriota bacterium]
MTRTYWERWYALAVVGVAILGTMIAWGIYGGPVKLGASSEPASRQPTASPQLVSIEPLPAMDGPMCEWVPASAGSGMMLSLASLQQGRTTPASDAQSSAPLETDISPVRVIRDNYPSYSAIVV